jgi:DNA-binding transcriptional MerR regulator
MSAETADDLRDVIALGGRIDTLELTVGQVCRTAGVSKQQLDYWTLKARIPTLGNKQRLYDLASLKTILQIKQSLASGRTLAATIAALPARRPS